MPAEACYNVPVMNIFRALLLIIEAVFSIVALATENYWLFVPALLAAIYDYASSRHSK